MARGVKPSLSLAANIAALSLLVACGGPSPPVETAAAPEALSASPQESAMTSRAVVSLRVPRSPDEAFARYTEEMGAW
jgi:hypothetical protein